MGCTVRLGEVLVRDHADLHDFLVSRFGFRIQGSGFLAYGRWSLVSGLGFRGSSFWFLVDGSGFRVWVWEK